MSYLREKVLTLLSYSWASELVYLYSFSYYHQTIPKFLSPALTSLLASHAQSLPAYNTTLQGYSSNTSKSTSTKYHLPAPNSQSPRLKTSPCRWLSMSESQCLKVSKIHSYFKISILFRLTVPTRVSYFSLELNLPYCYLSIHFLPHQFILHPAGR